MRNGFGADRGRPAIALPADRMAKPGVLALLAFALSAGMSLARAADEPGRALPPSVEQALRWLPEDTETRIVARPFTLHTLGDQPDAALRVTWGDVGGSLWQNGLDRDACHLLDLLRGRKVESVVHGAKNYESVSSFGCLRAEGCSILRFADDAPEAVAAWTEARRRDVRERRTVRGREVLVYEARFVVEPWTRSTDWQGTFLVVLDPRTMLLATSDRLLATVLDRIDEPGTGRALPATLPEWRHVDTEAPSWLIRHFPYQQTRAHAVGVTAAWRDGFCITYVARAGATVARQPIQNLWFPDNLRLEQHPTNGTTFAPLADGSLQFDYQEPDDFAMNNLWLNWSMHWIMATETSLKNE